MKLNIDFITVQFCVYEKLFFVSFLDKNKKKENKKKRKFPKKIQYESRF